MWGTSAKSSSFLEVKANTMVSAVVPIQLSFLDIAHGKIDTTIIDN